MAKAGGISRLGKAILFIALAVVAIYVGVMIGHMKQFQAPMEQGNQPAFGQLTIYTPWSTGLTFGERAMGFVGMILGYGADGGQEIDMSIFIVSLMIAIIIFVALGDILSVFSAFSTAVAWIIAFGIGVLAGVTGIVNSITVMFGVTAGLSAIGIGLIILSSVAAAVLLHLGIGDALKRWVWERQIGIEAMKAETGTERIKMGMKSLASIAEEAEEAGRKKKAGR